MNIQQYREPTDTGDEDRLNESEAAVATSDFISELAHERYRVEGGTDNPLDTYGFSHLNGLFWDGEDNVTVGDLIETTEEELLSPDEFADIATEARDLGDTSVTDFTTWLHHIVLPDFILKGKDGGGQEIATMIIASADHLGYFEEDAEIVAPVIALMLEVVRSNVISAYGTAEELPQSYEDLESFYTDYDALMESTAQAVTDTLSALGRVL